MKELIEKIVERLQDLRDSNSNSAKVSWNRNNRLIFSHISQTFQQSIDIIQEEAKAYNYGWIPCSERLPDAEADVLLSLRSLDIYVGFMANTEGMFYVEGEGYVEYENVLAWQPLPTPYQPKGE